MATSPDQNPDNWSAIADAYQHSFEGLTTRFAADALRRLDLKPGERVIDVAAGTGAFSLLAAHAGADVLATDFAPGMVARLRERIAATRLTGISAEVMDGQALAVPDAWFDASASILGLIFFPDIPRGISELRRVLRSNGRTAIVCWNDPRRLELMTLVAQAVRQVVPTFEPPAVPPVWAQLSGANLAERMQQSGFRQVEIATSTQSLVLDSPESFWNGFASSVPPLAFLFRQLGPEKTAEVGRAYIAALKAASDDGVATLRAEACVGIGRA